MSHRPLGNIPESNCSKALDLQRVALLCMLDASVKLLLLVLNGGISLTWASVVFLHPHVVVLKSNKWSLTDEWEDTFGCSEKAKLERSP